MGNLISFPATETISNQQVTENREKGNYKDGVYTGVGEGFRGTTEVQVTVEDGYIADITVLSFRDDREFFNKAQSSVINAILTKQTTDVSAVSGATFSSNSIMDAVEDALGSSIGSFEQSADESNPEDSSVETEENREQTGSDESQTSGDNVSEPSDSGQESDPVSGRFSVADGTYVGTGNGFRGTTSVSVTVENGAITDITINSYGDDDAYFTRARDTVIREIISTQSMNVQAVSGATLSSNSIMDAVADALRSASDRLEQPTGGESGSGAGEGNGSGSGQHDTGGHGGGWHGGSGNGGFGGRQNGRRK